MSSRGRNEIYTCVGVLLLILAIALYAAYVYYGFLPFVIGGFFVAIFAAWVAYSSRKAKRAKPATTQPTFSTFQHATPEEREKLLELEGFTKYTDENGNLRWRPPQNGMPEWLKAEKIDMVFKDGAMQIEMERESPKIRCAYCGTVYAENLDKCPNCGASRQGNEERVQDTPTSA